MKKRESFNTRWGFILACIGSAVGMGNIWDVSHQSIVIWRRSISDSVLYLCGADRIYRGDRRDDIRTCNEIRSD